MTPITEYRVESRLNYLGLVKDVNEAIADGWQPLGAVQTAPSVRKADGFEDPVTVYTQTLVRYAEAVSDTAGPAPEDSAESPDLMDLAAGHDLSVRAASLLRRLHEQGCRTPSEAIVRLQAAPKGPNKPGWLRNSGKRTLDEVTTFLTSSLA